MELRKGDTVKVLSGVDKGKTGEILDVIASENKVLVKGVNVRKKSVKPRKQGDEGGIISVEVAIPASKVNLVCPKCKAATKIGHVEEKGEMVRVCKKCGAKLK